MDLKVFRVCMVFKDVNRGMVLKGFKAFGVSMVLKVFRVSMVLRDGNRGTACKDPKDSGVFKDLKGVKA
jgi:hypothetical protein